MQLATLSALASLALASSSLAQTGPGADLPAYDRPGSLLVFPEYDHRPGRETFLTVTNTKTTGGNVRIRFTYVNETSCNHFTRHHVLTPGDTLSVLTGSHSPTPLTRGFVYVFAERASSPFDPISYNHLIGHAVQADSVSVYEYGHGALAFRAIAREGASTDVDRDGVRDLDGAEYAQAPERLVFPAFLGQSSFRTSELVLVGLTGGASFTTRVNGLLYNDNEEVFSFGFEFDCTARVPLTSLSLLFSNSFLQLTSHDPAEVVGVTALESGWFVIDGDVVFSTRVTLPDPAVIGFLVRGSGSTFADGLPFYDGWQGNGDLLPTSVLGD